MKGDVMTQQDLKDHFTKWCTKFENAQTTTMSLEVSKLFIALCLLEMKAEDVQLPVDLFSYKILDKRSEYIGLHMNDYTKTFFSFLCHSPGELVMYLYYLRSKNSNGEIITMQTVTMLFLMGFPTPKALEELWDAQKIPELDNLLDHLTF